MNSVYVLRSSSQPALSGKQHYLSFLDCMFCMFHRETNQPENQSMTMPAEFNIWFYKKKKKSKNNHHSFRFLSLTSIYIKTLYCTFFFFCFLLFFSCFSSSLASCYLELVRREENRKALEPNQFQVIGFACAALQRTLYNY